MATTATRAAVTTAARLENLIDAHAPDAGRRLGEWFRPALRDGETLPDFALVLRLSARLVGLGGRRLFERQNALEDAGAQEAEARFERDKAASALRRKLVELRRLLSSMHGPRRAATLLGIEGETALQTQHARLLEHAEAFLRLLRDPERPAAARTDAFLFEPAVAAGEIEPLHAELGAALRRCDEVRRTGAARREARERAWVELGRAVRCVVFLCRGCLALIRRGDLAEKIRRIQQTWKEVPM